MAAMLRQFFLEYFNFQNLSPNIIQVVLISLATLLFCKIAVSAMRRKSKNPPGPLGLPVIGYLPFLGKEPHKTLVDMQKKYGSIIGLYMGSTYTVFLNDYNAMKEVLTNPSALNRASSIFEHLSVGFLSANGEEWVEQRRFSMSATKDLGLGGGAWENVIMEEVQSFLKEMRKSEGEPIDISHPLSYSISSNIVSLLMGRKFQKDVDAEKIRLSLEFADVSLIYTGPSMPATILPWLRKYLEFFRIAGYDKAAKISNDFAKFVREEINNHKSFAKFRNVRDFINIYMEKLSSMTQSKKEKHYFSEKNLEGSLTTLFLGGSDTIFSSLVWLIRLMAEHPDVQSKVYKELMEVVGKDGTARYAERNKIPFTFAVLMESQRYSSIVALSSTRITFEDIAFNGYVIPRGANIVTNLWALHNDPNYWDSPEKFQPERFLSKDGTTLIKSPQSYAPFSIGRRNCPGETIAWMEILAYFTEIIKEFEIAPAPGEQVKFDSINGLVSKLKPQPLCFTKRNAKS